MINSAYIVQSRIISLGHIPFEVGKNKKIPLAFQPIFGSETCFTDMRMSIMDSERREGIDRLSMRTPYKPFFQTLGQILFDTHIARFSNTFDRTVLAKLLGKSENYWDSQASLTEPHLLGYGVLGHKPDIFGYDYELKDQRMNHLYFEIRHPLFMKATFNGKTMADGEIFIHLYPSGFLVLHLAIACKQQNLLQNFPGFLEAVRETRPGYSNNRWTWITRLGRGTLSDIVELINKSIHHSLHLRDSLPTSKWFAALKLVSDSNPQEIANGLMVHKHEILEFGSYTSLQSERIYKKYLLATDQGLMCILSPDHQRTSALRIFWKIHALYEFVLLKSHIYGNYAEYLRNEIANLREYRLNVTGATETSNEFLVYDPKIRLYLLTLDNHIRRSSPYFKRVYSFLSQQFALDSHREQTLKIVGQWENEFEQYKQTLKEFKTINKLKETDKMSASTILFLAADPSDATRLRLGEEFKQINDNLRKSQMREAFKLALPQLSARPSDISQAILDEHPRIVHFSGHGTSSGELCFEDAMGKTQTVQADALAALFELVSNEVECVILNACYSATQAQEITKHINYVIGMNKAIGDEAAISFTVGFYQALGAGRSIEDAYRFGCVQIRLQTILEHLTPVLIKKGQALSS